MLPKRLLESWEIVPHLRPQSSSVFLASRTSKNRLALCLLATFYLLTTNLLHYPFLLKLCRFEKKETRLPGYTSD